MSRFSVTVFKCVMSVGLMVFSGSAQTQSADEARTHNVFIKDFKFAPAEIVIRPGDAVVWANEDIVPHTATAPDDSWDTGSLGQGENKKVILPGGIEVTYYCRFHPNMTATIRILDQ